MAVHSAKDLPVDIAEGLAISAVLPRGDVRDVIVTRSGERIRDDVHCIIGTGSVRRRMGLQKLYPHSTFADIRGNVDTRIQKLLDGQYDALILAAAGLERLGIRAGQIALFPLSLDIILPAPCQGIIAVESRKTDAEMLPYLDTFHVFETERAILKLTGGNCDLPLGAYASISGETISLSVSDAADSVVSGSAPLADRFLLAERLVKQLEGR